MSPLKSYTVICTKNEIIARGVHEVRLSKPEGFTFKPGQFIMIDVPLLDNPEDIQPRAYSIASTPDEEEIILVIRIKEGGRAGEWISKALKSGMETIIQGPLGIFGVNEETEKNYFFLCTGVGSAPFRSLTKSLLKGGEKRRIDMVMGVLSEEDIFWKETFDTLAEEYENFTFQLVLSKPSDTWEGAQGYVQAVASELIPDLSSKSIYACGNPNMAKEAKELCANGWNVPKEDFHMEGYI